MKEKVAQKLLKIKCTLKKTVPLLVFSFTVWLECKHIINVTYIN